MYAAHYWQSLSGEWERTEGGMNVETVCEMYILYNKTRAQSATIQSAANEIRIPNENENTFKYKPIIKSKRKTTHTHRKLFKMKCVWFFVCWWLCFFYGTQTRTRNPMMKTTEVQHKNQTKRICGFFQYIYVNEYICMVIWWEFVRMGFVKPIRYGIGLWMSNSDHFL